MKCLRGNARGYDERIVPLQSGLAFAPNRCRDQLPKRPVMQSHGITLSFHREMADSSRELVGPDFSAAVIFESYPRFIKGGFQDYEGLGIKRFTADSKHVPSPRSRLLGNNLFEPPSKSSRIFEITWPFKSRPRRGTSGTSRPAFSPSTSNSTSR